MMQRVSERTFAGLDSLWVPRDCVYSVRTSRRGELFKGINERR
jgi:hypothetical protein